MFTKPHICHAQAQSSFYDVVPLAKESSSKYLRYSCTCPDFYQWRMCKHALGLALARGEVEVPPEKDVNIIGMVAKRGRPRKVVECDDCDDDV